MLGPLAFELMNVQKIVEHPDQRVTTSSGQVEKTRAPFRSERIAICATVLTLDVSPSHFTEVFRRVVGVTPSANRGR